MTPPPSAHRIDYTQFARFHPDANGSTGRAVFIDPKLIVRFMELIDLQKPLGRQVAAGLINLKSTAAGSTSDSNCSNAFQHRITLHNVVATYTILQTGGRGAGVYITDLRSGYSHDKNVPGLYRILQDSAGLNRWRAEQDDSPRIPYGIGVLGACPPDAEGVSSAAYTADQLVSGPLLQEARNLYKGFSLFYTPAYVVDGQGVWLTAQQKSSSAQANCPQKFARLMANSTMKANSNEVVQKKTWYIVGNGAKVFQAALKEYARLSSEPLNKSHQFYFIDPQVPLSALQSDLRNNGLDFYHDRSILDSSMGSASRMHQLTDPDNVYINMHRSCVLNRSVSEKVEVSNKALSDLHKPTTYFSEVVKRLDVSLSGRWR